jgi:excisionase family DNA binding protein
MESAAAVATVATPITDETPRRFGWWLMSVPAIARQTGLRRPMIYQAIRSGSLAPVRWVGRRVYVRSDIVEKWALNAEGEKYTAPQPVALPTTPPPRKNDSKRRPRRSA